MCFLFRRNALFFSVLALCACTREKSLFERMSASDTHITFSNTLDSTKDHRALYFFYYYNGAGVATGDINNDGLDDVYFTANSRGNNKLYLNKGNMQFEDITQKAGVGGTADWCSGATMVDLNGDGFLDIYVCSVNNLYDYKGHNALYINNKNNTFTESSAQYGLNISSFSTQAAFFDYDLDGDMDCYLLNQSQKPNENLRDTSFRREYSELAGDRLLRNDLRQGGKFTDVSKSAGIYQSSLGYGLGIGIADLNHDGFDDIYVGNDFHENDYCYLNNGNGTFTEKGASLFNHYSRFSMGNDIGDFDNDGHPDLFTADMLPPDEKNLKTYSSGEGFDVYKMIITQNGYQHQYSRNNLHRNNGYAQSFSDIALLHNLSATDWSWSPLLADFNNDGFKDLFISAGIPKRTVDLDFTHYLSNIQLRPGQDPKPAYNKALKMLPDGASHNFFFEGNGAKGFTEKSKAWGLTEFGYHTGAAHADFDNDGDLDLALNPINGQAFIYRNNTNPGNFIKLKLEGPELNRFGVGVKAWCFSAKGLQYQQFHPVKGFQSSSFHSLHFGLDSLASADSLLVVWPDHTFQVLKNIRTGDVEIKHQNAGGAFDHQKFFAPKSPEKQLVPINIGLSWRHIEDPFNDFTTQYLLPHQWSTRGPKLAVADVNRDGLDDFFVCGALGQSGSLFVQARNGKFVEQAAQTFVADKDAEDTDALFLDANGDSNMDLLLVSGGNVYQPGSPLLADRLYLNDGKGMFSKALGALPPILSHKSCAAAGDVDGDGDPDLFFGVQAHPAAFGTPQKSVLLLNDGRGKFSPAPENLLDLDLPGFVTDALLVDINGDHKIDLAVAGEWMPITLFINQGNVFAKKTLSGSGLWQCLRLEDVNHDGKVDLLGGNWGLNSKIKATSEQPIRLYVNDFDNNGQKDPILCYSKNGQTFSFLGRDELEKVLPFVKKKFNTFASFAGKPVEEVFDLNKEGLNTFEASVTASSVFVQDGNGNFTRTDLPLNCQLSPIFDFLALDPNGQLLSGGNFYGVRPFEGRYDAAALVRFDWSSSGGNSAVLSIKGEVRDMAWIQVKGEQVLLVARNNSSIEGYVYR